MLRNKRYADLYRRYLKEALKFDGKDKKILKADCSNEYYGYPFFQQKPEHHPNPYLVPWGIAPLMEADMTLIEINPEIIEKVNDFTEGMIKVIEGDIRKMPFEDEEFDVVMDLSTLDHIPYKDTKKALEEYRRVLKKDGHALLISWTGGDRMSADAYYHSFERLDKEIRELFNIVRTEMMLEEIGGKLCLWATM
jgi:SAM-dependent methyltransferase